jgi:hypothetical protein
MTDEELAERIVTSMLDDGDGDLATVLLDAQARGRDRALALAGKRLGEMGWTEAQHAVQRGSAIAYAQRKLRSYWFSGKRLSGPRSATLMDALKTAPKEIADQVVRRFWSLGCGHQIELPRPPGEDTDRLG